jgi:hypothetical protein
MTWPAAHTELRRSCPDRAVRAAVPAPAMTPPRPTLDVSSSLPPQARLMRRRAHQLAYVRPVVPDVCPRPLRFQCCPTLDLTASLAAPAAFGAQAAGGARQPFRKIALAALAGGMPHPTAISTGAATAVIVGQVPVAWLRRDPLAGSGAESLEVVGWADLGSCGCVGDEDAGAPSRRGRGSGGLRPIRRAARPRRRRRGG